MTGKNGELYLRQNALIEPLFNQWYAWSHLIPPATAAMFVANSHLKIMQSFINSPQVHLSAMKNPAMIGGPFINYGAKRADEIKALMEKTIKEQACLLSLAQAIKALDEMLMNDAGGYSLEPMYPRVPEALKGYVELVYDLNNQPSIRFIEGLLLKSPYYKTSSQSLALSLIQGDDRSFVFSTPRLEDESRYFLRIPFSHDGLDELMRMRSAPQSPGRIRELLGVAQDDDGFSQFFTAEPPPRRPPYDSEGVRISYFGHACLLIETNRTTILTDPVISYKYDSEIPRFTHADLPDTIDFVLVTHNHQDHFALETLLQLRHKTRNVVVPKNSGGRLADPSLKLILQNIGFKQVIELDEVESVACADGSITGLPFLGEHADLDIKSKMAYLVRVAGRSVLIAADSNNLEPRLYDHIHDLAADVDAVFLGMECDGAPLTWIYGPLLTRPLTRKMDQSRRFDGSNYEKAAEIVKRLNPKQVYVYAMGQEPWLTYLVAVHYTEQSRPIVESNKLVADCRSRGMTSERLFGKKEIFL